VVDWTSVVIPVIIAAPAYAFAALTYLESRRQRELLETMTKAIPFVTPRSRRVRTPAKKPAPAPGPSPPKFGLGHIYDPQDSAPKLALQQKAEERRLLKLQLEREKEQWRRQKDVSKAIGWIINHLGSSEEDEEDYEED
jgi:hypothetical protein